MRAFPAGSTLSSRTSLWVTPVLSPLQSHLWGTVPGGGPLRTGPLSGPTPGESGTHPRGVWTIFPIPPGIQLRSHTPGTPLTPGTGTPTLAGCHVGDVCCHDGKELFELYVEGPLSSRCAGVRGSLAPVPSAYARVGTRVVVPSFIGCAPRGSVGACLRPRHTYREPEPCPYPPRVRPRDPSLALLSPESLLWSVCRDR